MLEPVDNLIRALSRLPGLGRRSAERAALALISKPDQLAAPLLQALGEVRDTVICCELCGGLTLAGQQPCRMCVDQNRDSKLLCVVEEPADILAIERSGVYNGRYHALHGKLSPSRRNSPENLRFRELFQRIPEDGIEEVVLALSTDLEGDATAAYINEMLVSAKVKVSRLAFGLPTDSGIGYSDPVTLKRAINGRFPV